jgi:hypothetical protein
MIVKCFDVFHLQGVSDDEDKKSGERYVEICAIVFVFERTLFRGIRSD